MEILRLPDMFNKVRFSLASLCFIYSIFMCGFAVGLSITEKMLAVEAKILRPDISFSGGPSTGYSGLSIKFLMISAGFLVFILLTGSSRIRLTEVTSLMIVLGAVYLLLTPAPGYLPGQTLMDSSNYLQLIGWCDLVLFCLTLVLIVLQAVAIWQGSKSPSHKI